jgi:hypothetical protein
MLWRDHGITNRQEPTTKRGYMHTMQAENNQRRVDTHELSLSSWLDRLDPSYWVRSGRMGTGEARKASVAMIWSFGSDEPESALAYAKAVCEDEAAPQMEVRFAGVATLAAWTAQGKAMPWATTDRWGSGGEDSSWSDCGMDCAVFDVIHKMQPEPCIKSVGMSAFRAMVAAREMMALAKQARSQGLDPVAPSSLEAMCQDDAWSGFDPERMRARMEGRPWLKVGTSAMGQNNLSVAPDFLALSPKALLVAHASVGARRFAIKAVKAALGMCIDSAKARPR